MPLKGFVNARTKPVGLSAEDGVRYWQERIVMAFIMVCAYLGFLVYLPSVALSIKESLWVVAAVDTLMYGWMIFLYRHQGLPYTLRASTIALVTYILGLVLLLTIGPYGAGPVWLFAFPVVAALLLGLPTAIGSLVLNGMTLVVLGFFLEIGVQRWGLGVLNSLEKWIVVAMNFMLLNILVTLSVAQIARGLSQALKRQKGMLDRLAESEERFRTLFESAPDGYFLYDLNGMILDGNSTLERMLGVRCEDLVGQPVAEFFMVSGGRQTSLDMIVRQNQQLQGSGPDECVLRRQNGESILVELLTVPTTIKADTFVLGIVRDITERKRLESSLAHAQKMESIGTLAGGVAHDFNNLLQAIGGYTDLLTMDKSEGHPDWQNLMVIQRSVDRAAQLVKQLLLFSRKAHAQPRPLDLNRSMTQALKILERTLPKMIQLEFKPDQDLWAIEADPVQMEQLLLNLGSNAADAMPDGGTFRVETENIWLGQGFPDTHPGVAPGQFVMLKVSDTGVGMDPETVKHIFEPFFTSKDVGKGTGLGLASVYGIVKGHGGSITCSSVKGQGTEFSIYLPTTSTGATGQENGSEKELPTGRQETLLVVDDEPEIRDLLEKMLHHYGYQTLLSASGEEALELFHKKREEIALVILDLNMPGMGGWKCLSALQESQPGVKVLIASGYSDHRPMDVMARGQVSGFIEKPYDPPRLLKAIRDILG